MTLAVSGYKNPRDRERVNERGVLCRSCWTRRPPELFLVYQDGPRKGQFHGYCGGVAGFGGCKEKYRAWSRLTDAEKLAQVKPFESDDAYSATLVLRSGNRKLGPIPVSQTARGSCPDSCSFKNAGCFAEVSWSKIHWSKVPERGMRWGQFCLAVSRLPEKQIWRHNEAGDLPGRGDKLDVHALALLVRANEGRRGFTFTHVPVLESKPVPERARYRMSASERRFWLPSNRRAIAAAVACGFVVNLSADSVAQADELADLGIAPVAVVVPHDTPPRAFKTPAGRQVVICPNETTGITCADCQLCAVPTRKAVIAFRAHGQSRQIVSNIVRARRTT